MADPKVDRPRGPRKVVIWRVVHRYFTRVDADVWDGERGPKRSLDLTEEQAVDLIRKLFGA